MEDMIERSEDSRAHFDALMYLVIAIKYRGKELPVPLYFWWRGVCRRASAPSPLGPYLVPTPGQFGNPSA